MKKLLLFICICACTFSLKAQIDLGSFLEGGIEDGNRLLENYMEPAFVGLGQGLNSGWYNTGKPHKLLGFDLTVNVNLSFIPTEDEFFTFRESDYDNVRLADPSQDQLPTLFGPNLQADEIPELSFRDPDNPELELLKITAPTGLGLDEEFPVNAVPSPMVQLGIGLFKSTELKIRFVPEVSAGDEGEEFRASMLGLGVMHDVKQWIPGMKLLPFDLSTFVGFNRLSLSFDVDDVMAGEPRREADLSINGFTFQGIISKEIAVLTVYAGLGFLTSSTDFSLSGEYDVDFQDEPLVDPVDFSYSSSSPKLNVGARVKLLILTLHAEYALQTYDTFTVGLGFSVR